MTLEVTNDKKLNSADVGKDILLVYDCKKLTFGELTRYKLTVDKTKLEANGINSDKLFLRVKNKENPLLRPVFLTGPYAFYVDVRPHNYNEDKKFEGSETIPFIENLKPGDSFKPVLLLNENSQIEGTSLYSWTIDIICQLTVVNYPKLTYSIRVGTSRAASKTRSKTYEEVDGVKLEQWDTKSLWSFPPKYPDKPIHLVIITHGIFSNVGSDMLYMKDKIEEVTYPMEESVNPNVVVRGCFANEGKSGRGVQYLGKRVGEYVIKTVDELSQKYRVGKISFIGHSLGGPTQAMAVHYISVKRPDIFDPETGVKPENFIALASPFIGVIGDFPFYLSLPLDMGSLGLTGRDLNLRYTPLTSKDGLYTEEQKLSGRNGVNQPKLIMEILPQSPAKEVFERFSKRTVYANVVHDGIVPLRTAALLYLNWSGLAKVAKVQKADAEPLIIKVDKDGDVVLPTRDEMTPVTDMGAEEEKEEIAKHHNDITGEIPEKGVETRKVSQTSARKVPILQYRKRKFIRAQTLDVATGVEARQVQQEKFIAPKEASTVLSALSVLTAPMPTQEYIKNPDKRKDSIIHDKVYHPDELPDPYYEGKSDLRKVIFINESVKRAEERIARAWQETMDWRKVLVRIQPDSHNNIVVRRRFVNLYGNVAVHHLVHEHFGASLT